MKSWILAVDTTSEYGSLALMRGAETAEEVPLHSPSGYAHVIYGHLAELLQRHAVAPADIACFASASGPGSFTGVRVGLACVKGLAAATGHPAAGISNLRAIASFGTAPLCAVAIDARRGDIYGAVYAASGQIVAPETVARLDRWIEMLPEGELEFVTPDDGTLRAALAATRFAARPVTASPRALAAAIGRIAAAQLERGEAVDPALLDANYVRRSDAELFWKEI